MEYCSREWLSPTTHSSAYVMCYYNPDCLNTDYILFVRIADCSDSFVINTRVRNIVGMIKILNNIIDVIKDRRSSYTFGNKVQRYRITKQTTSRGDNGFYSSIKVYKYYANKINKKYSGIDKRMEELIRLHADPETCDKEEWERKTCVLATELKKFVEFLNFILTMPE